ncbi:MAG: hypothetical protein ABSD70_13845 [Terracidiphilus sp.]|jgi:hypothetical protein
MRLFKSLALLSVVTCLLGAGSANLRAQIAIGVNIGPEPICPYGYFDYAPYNCAPYGYYGPDWFNGGVFIGVGPWFHGPHGFAGHVDNRYDPRHGYHGPVPARGAQPFNHFQGNEARDGRGHIAAHPDHDAGNEHAAGFSGHGGPGGHR